MFNDTISSLGLSEYQYRPYSLRRGGATFYFQRHGQLDRLLIQGRWQSSKTARLYINSGLATLAETELRLTPHARVFHKHRVATVRFSSVSRNLTAATVGSVTVRFGSNWHG